MNSPLFRVGGGGHLKVFTRMASPRNLDNVLINLKLYLLCDTLGHGMRPSVWRAVGARGSLRIHITPHPTEHSSVGDAPNGALTFHRFSKLYKPHLDDASWR
jgi:hypothetical protein